MTTTCWQNECDNGVPRSEATGSVTPRQLLKNCRESPTIEIRATGAESSVADEIGELVEDLLGGRVDEQRPLQRLESIRVVEPRDGADHRPDARRAAGRLPAAWVRQPRSSSATHSTCGVCGNMSTGWTVFRTQPASTSWAALGASVVGLQET